MTNYFVTAFEYKGARVKVFRTGHGFATEGYKALIDNEYFVSAPSKPAVTLAAKHAVDNNPRYS